MHTSSNVLKIYAFTGKCIYFVTKPLLRLMMRSTQRSYVMLRCDQDVLLVKTLIGDQSWELPGGGKKNTETPDRTAAREVLEEVGVAINPGDLTLHKKGVWGTEGFEYTYYIYKIALKHKPEIRRGKEILSFAWIPLTELRKHRVKNEVRSALKSIDNI